ncbi:MAG TPA: hypothetical protein VGZ52_12355 [Acidimicrobiales bacterium]|jgi:hypothetical protein|nr:hypothetical protein [Acidimicrobiales bacterium]
MRFRRKRRKDDFDDASFSANLARLEGAKSDAPDRDDDRSGDNQAPPDDTRRDD